MLGQHYGKSVNNCEHKLKELFLISTTKYFTKIYNLHKWLYFIFSPPPFIPTYISGSTIQSSDLPVHFTSCDNLLQYREVHIFILFILKFSFVIFLVFNFNKCKRFFYAENKYLPTYIYKTPTIYYLTNHLYVFIYCCC